MAEKVRTDLVNILPAEKIRGMMAEKPAARNDDGRKEKIRGMMAEKVHTDMEHLSAAISGSRNGRGSCLPMNDVVDRNGFCNMSGNTPLSVERMLALVARSEIKSAQTRGKGEQRRYVPCQRETMMAEKFCRQKRYISRQRDDDGREGFCRQKWYILAAFFCRYKRYVPSQRETMMAEKAHNDIEYSAGRKDVAETYGRKAIFGSRNGRGILSTLATPAL
ncbi:hypothetical protein QBC37DRAFT_407580 [Rhypophila decipiens]|uniref:Uncharacterized protein n=1 Tax=Rhypophila decipiens TaxID=261697 RepID=A0AAN6XWM7_9PEZI|nr:hypothetical protein QBC37DRAFT_407580 [Rhypophila decipiens]